jgi:hypothetical protein
LWVLGKNGERGPMTKSRLACPECGAQLTAPEGMTGKKMKCPKCGAVVETPPDEPTSTDEAPGQERTEGDETPRSRSVVGLRLGLALNALRRYPLAAYCAARTWGERYELWVRLLACLLPFGIGGLVSWCLWVFLPESAAFRGAIGVLLLTVACGAPLLVVFFPGARAEKARRSLGQLHARAQDARAELAGRTGKKVEARIARAAEKARAKRERAPAPGGKAQLKPGPRPGYGILRLFSVSASIIGAMHLLLAVVLAIVAVARRNADIVAMASVAFLAWTGLLLLFVGQLLALLRDVGRNLWRISSTLDRLQEDLGRRQGQAESPVSASQDLGSDADQPAPASPRQQAIGLLKGYVDGAIGGGELIRRYPAGQGQDDLLDAIVHAFCEPLGSKGVDADEHYRLVATKGIQAIEEGWDAGKLRGALPG